MSTLLEKLTAEGGGESVRKLDRHLLVYPRMGSQTDLCPEFLNDIVAQLWPNINVAGCKMARDIAEPMFKSMLPGPLASLHFTKLDLCQVPFQLSNCLVTKTETGSIKLDLNVDWAGKCDIELDASMMPTVVSYISAVL